jgi:hypothetical protein
MFVAAIVLSAAIVAQGDVWATVAEYEAEDQQTSGRVIGPDRKYGSVAAEASGRRAVSLDRSGQWIQFTLRASARGLTIRYSLAASPIEWGRRSSADIIVAGRRIATVPLRSRYSTTAPMPPDQHLAGRVHHFWDEARVVLPRSLPAGTKLKLRMSPTARAKPFAIDLIDTIALADPRPSPPGAISAQSFGADPTGRYSSRKALVSAISAARASHKALYVPPGLYRVDGRLIVDRVVIQGAGSWYSILRGHNLGFYSRETGSSRVTLSSFAVESDVAKREDALPQAAVGGRFSESRFTALYLHHAKAGIWLDGPANDIAITDTEIADQAADGINLHRGIVDALVENNRIRNVGDDGIASWSDGMANQRVIIRGNRITAPGLANGIALYGGRDLEVSKNQIADTVIEGGGIHLGTRFRSTPFEGTILVADNLLIRSGSMDPNWRFGVGAIWLYALEKPINADVEIRNNRIEDASCEAVQLLGPQSIDGVRIEGLQTDSSGADLFAFQAAGSAFVDGVVSKEEPGDAGVAIPDDFRLVTGKRNRGWRMRGVRAPHSPRCR